MCKSGRKDGWPAVRNMQEHSKERILLDDVSFVIHVVMNLGKDVRIWNWQSLKEKKMKK